MGAPRYLLHVATALFVAASGLAPPASALISRWEAGSGLLPDEICQPFGLEDTATPEEPVLGATFLTISTDVDAEHMGYFHSGADVSFTDPLVIEARLRVLSGSGVVTFRAPVEILFTLSPEFGNALYLDVDEIFVLSDNNTKGDSAVVELDAFPGKMFSARVSSIGNSAIQTTAGGAPAQATGGVDFEVILTLLDAPAALRPDLSTTADIIVDQKVGVPAVPIISVTVRSQEDADQLQFGGPLDDGPTGPIARAQKLRPLEGVFVVRDGVAVWTPVILGITGQEHFEILSGASVGDTVVSGPYQTIQDLSDGDDVRLAGGTPR